MAANSEPKLISGNANLTLAKAIALVFAAPATIAAAPFIETHALFVFPVRP